MTLGERLEWLGRLTLLVFILASAACLSAITAMRIAIHGREVTMPTPPVDTVVIQNPKPGAGAATPRVDVLVSQGPRELAYVMPHLTGLNEIEAQRRLDIAQMRRKVNYVTAPQWPHGAVIDQSPMSGTRIPASSTIELTVAN